MFFVPTLVTGLTIFPHVSDRAQAPTFSPTLAKAPALLHDSNNRTSDEKSEKLMILQSDRTLQKHRKIDVFCCQESG